MATGRRTRLHPEHRRAQLLELGMEMLSTHRLDEVAIDEIAAAAGISRGLLFHYFPSKRAFHLAVVEAAAARLLERTAPDPGLSPLEQLHAGVATFVDHVASHPASYVALVRGAAGGDGEVRAIFERARATVCDRVLAALELPAPPPATIRATVRGWLAFADELVVDWASGADRDLDRDQVIALLHDALVALVRTATPPRARAAPDPRAGPGAPGTDRSRAQRAPT